MRREREDPQHKRHMSEESHESLSVLHPWDGSGYPDKLKGEEIPFEARLMAVADVYDALVSERCYKKAMSFEEASKIMLESMGTHFDPEFEQVFLLSQQRLENYYYYDK